MNLNPPTKRVCARVITTLLLSVLCVFAGSQLLTTRAAGPFTVNSLGDTPDANPGNGVCADANGACTLRAAIMEANSNAIENTVNFSVTGTINLTGALPQIFSNVKINGPGSGSLTVRRDTGGNYRIFQSSGFVEISGMTITNGRTPDGVTEDVAPSGGGIWQISGFLTLRDVVITGNVTGDGGSQRLGSPNFGGFGGFGGGIYASGTLTLTDCVISNNTTGKGGNGLSFGGSGGRGAGMYFALGTLTLKNTVISGNHTGNSGGPTSGNSGYGGGIWIGEFSLGAGPNVTMNKVTITNNSTGDNISTGDAGGGAGLYIDRGTIAITDSTVSNNHTGNANLSAFAATAGSGGGIFNNGLLTITNSVISGNTTGNSTPGANSTGGGISNTASLTLINTTVSGNSTGSGPSMGGGIFSFATTKLINCTITKNEASSGNGHGVTGNAGTVTIGNTIIAGNGPSANSADLNNPLFTPPTYVSLGHNLIGNVDGFSSSFNAAGDQKGTGAAPLNAQLGPLADNGGPATHALLSNSPALDAGDDAVAKDENNNPLTTDQRGAQRIADSPDADAIATVDIGAFEFLQMLEDIPNKTTSEDIPITITFGLGDAGPGVTSVTATSSNQAVVPDSNLVLSGSGFARTLQLIPAANQSGLAMITVTVNLSGGGSASDTFQLTVLPLNDPPTFTKGPDQTLLEDAGAQTVNNWATNISAGPNESGQTLSFIVTNNLPTLFSAPPAIDSSGTLTYTPAANRSGVATVTVVLKDDGGGQDSSPSQTFTITVTAVNDPPSFTKGPDQTVLEDAGFQFVSSWATNISGGPNEFESVQFQVTNNTNPSLFSTQPSVTSSGSLTYIPAANTSGSADITIVLKDFSGTANGGSDTSAPQTFKITVTAVNDAPVNTVPFSPQTNQQTPIVFSTATFNAISVSDADAGTDPIRVTLTGLAGTVTLGSTAGLEFLAGDGTDDDTMTIRGTISVINAALNGLSFKPSFGVSGTATLRIISNDEGHNGPDGAKTTTTNLDIQVRSGGRFNFNTNKYGVNESGGTTTITVLRAGGNAGTATVNYSTSSGTATQGTSCSAGVDFVGASGSFTWNNGDTSVRTFTVTICNDGLVEDDEIINLNLTNPAGTGSLGTQPTALLIVGDDDGALLLTEESTTHAIALDLVNLTRDPFSLTSPFNLGSDQRRRISLFVWRLGLLPSDTPASVTVVARDDEGRPYDLPVEALNPVFGLPDVTQVVIRLPDNVAGAPRDLLVKVTLRGQTTNEAFIKIAAP